MSQLFRIALGISVLVASVAHAAPWTMSYSGRLVDATGAPVAGEVDLTFDFYSASTAGTLLGTKTAHATLAEGLFTVSLTFSDAESLALFTAPGGVWVETKDTTNTRSYARQAFHAVPFAYRAETLAPAGAQAGDVLAFDGVKWVPTTPGTASIDDGDVTDQKIAPGVDAAKIGGGAISNTEFGYLNNVTGAIQTQLDGKQGTLTTGAGTQYFKGDLSLGTFQTDVSANTDVTANTAARHVAVTLGTANGLSLSTQQLSLGLASSSTTGALSSSDWSTFNGKVSSQWVTSGSDIGFTAGNVGIGVASPNASANLEIQKSGVSGSRLILSNNHATSKNAALGFYANGSQNWGFGTDSDGDGGGEIYFNNAGGTRVMTMKQTGEVGIGTGAANPDAALDIQPTRSIPTAGAIYGINSRVTYDLTATPGPVAGIYGNVSIPVLESSANDPNTTLVAASWNRIESNVGYAGSITTGYGYASWAPALSGSGKIANFTHFLGLAVSNTAGSNSGNTTGTINNTGLAVGGDLAAAGAGGTLNNVGVNVTVPNGSGAAGTTNNYGVKITGNSSAGDGNWAIYSDSTTPSFLAGNVGVGAGVTAPHSTLQVGGAVATAISGKTGAYTLAATDSIVTGNASGGAFSLTLPTAANIAGRTYTLKKTDSSANAITVATTSAQTIDGAASVSLAAQYDYVSVVSDGANWIVVASKIAASTPNTKAYSARIANNGTTCTISAEIGNWLDSAARSGAGRCDLLITSGAFASAPACTCTVNAENAGYNSICGFLNPSDNSTLEISTEYGGAVQDDIGFEITCIGP